MKKTYVKTKLIYNFRFENKSLKKLREENTLLQASLKSEVKRFEYLQKKHDVLQNEKQKNISLQRIPK